MAESIAQTNNQTVKKDISKESICVIIFAKYPAHGMAKTRLQPALGIDGAARMAR